MTIFLRLEIRWFLLLSFLLLVGCSTRGVIPGMDAQEGWDLTISALRLEGDVKRIDRRVGEVEVLRRMPIEDREFLEVIVHPFESLMSQTVSDRVVVYLGAPTPEGIPVKISAVRIYRTPFREFRRIRMPEMEQEVLKVILHQARIHREARGFEQFLKRRREEIGRKVEGMVYVEMPRGRFRMGRDGAYKNEQPQHTISITPFFIDQSEVTNEQYERFMKAGGYGTSKYWSTSGWAWLEVTGIEAPAVWEPLTDSNRNVPVRGVSWYEADAYARWAGKKLPTEVQWECAARGPFDLRWPWGNSFQDYCNHYGLESRQPWSAGTNPRGRSPVGADDMSGNVSEWVSDWYSSRTYTKADRNDSKGPKTGRKRVLRGGAYDSHLFELSTSYRDWSPPNHRHPTFGFRCVISLPSAEEQGGK